MRPSASCGIALGRKSWLFAGSDRGGERAAVMLTLIQTARLNDVDPQAWLADILARIADHKITDLAALLPWNWRRTVPVVRAARRGASPRHHHPPRRRDPRRGRDAVVGDRLGHGAGGTDASGSTTRMTNRTSPSRPPGWNISERCSVSTNETSHPRGLKRMVTK